MKKDQYLQHDASATENIRIARMVFAEKAEGYGIYWMLIEHLRKQDLYKSSMEYVEILSHKVNTSVEKIERIITKYQLFHMENGEFYSTGLCERMEKLDETRRKRVINGKKGGVAKARLDKALREGGNTMAVEDSKVKESREKESNSIIIRDNNPVHPAAAAAVQSWEKCVDALAKEQAWFDYMAMRSELGKERFRQQYPEIIKFFKQHIISYGKESSITTLSDAKSYFSNFILPGKPPHQRLLEKLDEARARNPYRFEDISPDGKRSYCGMPIPDDAPPRPSANALWGKGKWE